MVNERALTPMDIAALHEHACLTSQYNSASREEEPEALEEYLQSDLYLHSLDIPFELVARAEFLGTPEDERQTLYNIWVEDGMDDSVLSRIRNEFSLKE